MRKAVAVEQIEAFVIRTNRDGYVVVAKVWTMDGRLATVLGRTETLVLTSLGLFDFCHVKTAVVRPLSTLGQNDA